MNSSDLMDRMKNMDKMDYVCIAILVVFVLYSSFGIHFLPVSVLRLFTNKYFNFVMFSLLAATAFCCPKMGVMFAVALLLTICAAKFPTMEFMENVASDEVAQVKPMEPVMENMPGDQACVRTSSYRNEFYPQYINSDYFAYDAKNNYAGVGGFDSSSKFDSFEADNGSRSGLNDGTRSTYGSNRSTYN